VTFFCLLLSDFLTSSFAACYGGWLSLRNDAIDVTPDDRNRHLSIIRLICLHNNEILRATRPLDFFTLIPRKAERFVYVEEDAT